MSIDRTLLTDEQWVKIEPLLPKPRQSRQGGPATCWRRLRDWEAQGVWLKIWRAFLTELDQRGRLNWEETFADGSFAPAKKGATASAAPAKARAQSGWWWQAARVFLWESASTLPRRRK